MKVEVITNNKLIESNTKVDAISLKGDNMVDTISSLNDTSKMPSCERLSLQDTENFSDHYYVFQS